MLSGSVATAEQHTHSCSTAALSRENMDLLRHLPCQADREDGTVRDSVKTPLNFAG